eukprot:5382081-Pleurochrysis_carterae.AAC.1
MPAGLAPPGRCRPTWRNAAPRRAAVAEDKRLFSSGQIEQIHPSSPFISRFWWSAKDRPVQFKEIAQDAAQ